MRKFLFSAALAASALIAAVPAAAQYRPQQRGYGYQQQGQQYAVRIDRLQQRVQLLSDRGQFSRAEASRLNREAYQLRALFDRFRYDGISQREAYELDRRIVLLREQVREDRLDGRRYDDRRYDDRGYDDRRYDDRRYDDRRYDRDDDYRFRR